MSTEAVFRNGPSHELEEIVFEVATAANDHMITARSFMKDTPKAAIPALLSAVRTSCFFFSNCVSNDTYVADTFRYVLANTGEGKLQLIQPQVGEKELEVTI